MKLGIPNNPSLKGVKLNTQVWWINLSTILPIETSNGVQLVLGS